MSQTQRARLDCQVQAVNRIADKLVSYESETDWLGIGVAVTLACINAGIWLQLAYVVLQCR